MTHSRLTGCLLLAALLASQAAPALDGAALYAAKTCPACHGKDGRQALLPEYPRIAGQSAAYALQQMKDIKSGARSNGNSAAMKGVMHMVNEEEMKAIAEWLAQVPQRTQR